MNFCQKCGSILIPKKGEKQMKCPKCGHRVRAKINVVIKEKVNLGKEDKIEVVDKKVEVMPKTNQDCPKCKYHIAYYWTVQTRAGDESETRFFECTKCSHRWRDYS